MIDNPHLHLVVDMVADPEDNLDLCLWQDPGWHITERTRCLVIGNRLPKTWIPLEQVKRIDYIPAPDHCDTPDPRSPHEDVELPSAPEEDRGWSHA